MLQLDEKAQGKEFELRLNETFELHLRENPTTGFHWNLESNGHPICRPVSDSFERAEDGKGQGGYHRWNFQAVQVGEADIALVYHRSWEQAGARTFAFHVRVVE